MQSSPDNTCVITSPPLPFLMMLLLSNPLLMEGNQTFLIFMSGAVIAMLQFLMSFALRQVSSDFGLYL